METPEQQLRRKHMEGAIASVRQEGHVFSQEDLEDCEAIIRGDMTVEEFKAKTEAMVEKWRKESPEIFHK